MMAELAPPWGKFGNPLGQAGQRKCPGLGETGASSASGYIWYVD